ncbi:MAG: hypothetical protein ACREOW_04405 [Thermodesulfobacteriota bacterium]
MKYLSFFLALTTFLCYTGICADVCYSNNASEITTNAGCHGTKKQDTSNSAISYQSSNHINHKIYMCQDAIPNAPQGYDLNQSDIILSSPAVCMPTFEINKVHAFAFSINIKEHHPPELFLSNSSFLL